MNRGDFRGCLGRADKNVAAAIQKGVMVMRYVFSSLMSLVCLSGLALGQNPPTRQPGQTQPGQQPQAGQKIQGQQGQGQQGQGQPGQGQPGQPGQQPQQGQPRQQPGQQGVNTQPAGTADQQIAAMVCGCAENEIAVAKMAQSKAKSSEVKQFAEMMIKEHTPGCEAMKQLAGSLANHEGSDHATGSENAGRGAAAGQLDWVKVHQEVGRKCLASVKEELGSKEGAEFDHCFIGQQIGAHMKVMDELKVLRNYASSDLRQKLDHELETATTHYTKAKQIMEKLDEKSTDRVSRKPE